MQQIADLRASTNKHFADVPYIEMSEIIDQPIAILDAEVFSNRDDVPTVAIRFAFVGSDGGISDEVRMTTTHSGPIVDLMSGQEVRDLLAAGEPIGATVVEKKSKKTGRTYRTFA